MKFRLFLLRHLFMLGAKWPAAVALGDEDIRQTLEAGLSIAWRNLWRKENNLTITLPEADAVYATALRQGNREGAQELFKAVQEGRNEN